MVIRALLEVRKGEFAEGWEELRERLTVENPEYKNQVAYAGRVQEGTEEFLRFYWIEGEVVKFPRRVERKYFRGDVEDRRAIGREIVRGEVKLWKEQGELMERVRASGEDDVLICAPCGSGKTIMSLWRANELGVSTVVAVTTREIGEQFLGAVKRLFPEWRSGWANGGDNTLDFAVGTYALFMGERFGEEYFDGFGHIILDEFHRAGAPEFGKIMEKASCKYRTTLTATFRRKDGMEKVLRYHVGEIFYLRKEMLKAEVYVADTGLYIDRNDFRGVSRWPVKPYGGMEVAVERDGKEVVRGVVRRYDGKMLEVAKFDGKEVLRMESGGVVVRRLLTFSRVLLDNYLAEHEERVRKIFRMIERAYEAGRQVLVLCNRKVMLYRLEEMCKERGIVSGVLSSVQDRDYGEYSARYGRKAEEQRKWVIEKAPIILGIDRIANEGLDIPRLDTLILTFWMNDVEQVVGRILREYEGKKKPMVVYVMDDFDGARVHFKKAKRMLIGLGHEIKSTIKI